MGLLFVRCGKGKLPVRLPDFMIKVETLSLLDGVWLEGRSRQCERQQKNGYAGENFRRLEPCRSSAFARLALRNKDFKELSVFAPMPASGNMRSPFPIPLRARKRQTSSFSSSGGGAVRPRARRSPTAPAPAFAGMGKPCSNRYSASGKPSRTTTDTCAIACARCGLKSSSRRSFTGCIGRRSRTRTWRNHSP